MPAQWELRADAERRRNYTYLADVLRDLELDLRRGMKHSAALPQDWHDLAREAPVPRKCKLTLRLDEDVAAFFRQFGPGHLTRMNAVLRAFMLARQAEVLQGPETVNYAMSDRERLKDACDNWNSPGARDVRRAWVKKRLKELGVEEE